MKQFFQDRFLRPLLEYLESRRWTLETFPVRVVITGMEHSGTTILSILLKQHPRLECGFECGFLLAESPAAFQNIHPWYEWMQEPVSEHHWGVSAKDLQRICASNSWAEAYRKLMAYSPIFKEGLTQQICDKTPRYLKHLDRVLDQLHECVPCLVIEKDIRNLWLSHRKRHGDLGAFVESFEQYHEGLRRGLARHGQRIHRIQYETLCMDLETELPRIFSVLNLTCEPEYVSGRLENLRKYYNRIREQYASLTENEVDMLRNLRKKYADVLLLDGGGF